MPCAPPVMIATLSFSLMLPSLVDEHASVAIAEFVIDESWSWLDGHTWSRDVAPAGLLHQNAAAGNPEHEAYHAIGDDGIHADEPRDVWAASRCNDSRGGGPARGEASVPADGTHAQQGYRRGREGAPG